MSQDCSSRITTWADKRALEWKRLGDGDQEWPYWDSAGISLSLPYVERSGFYVIWYLYPGTSPRSYEEVAHIPCFTVGYGKVGTEIGNHLGDKALRDCALHIKYAHTPRILNNREDLREKILNYLAYKLFPEKPPETQMTGRIVIHLPKVPELPAKSKGRS